MAAGVKYFQFSLNSLIKCIHINHIKPNFLNGHGTQYIFARKYARKTLYRRPLKVITSDGREIQPDLHMTDEETQIENIKSQQNYKPNKISDDSPAESYTDIPHYIKLGDDSKAFSSVVSLAKSRKLREKSGKIFLEGKRLIQDALEAGVKLESLFFSQPESLEGLPLARDQTFKLYKVLYSHMSLWSDQTTAPGIIGIFQRPDRTQTTAANDGSLPLTVICDNIREPGNLGAILRCTAAVGCKQTLLTRGCVDLWDPKVLRAACGAHFRSTVENNVGWESVCNYFSKDAAVYLASKDADADGAAEVPRLHARHFRERRVYDVKDDGRIADPAYEDEDFLEDYRKLPLKSALYCDVDYGGDSEMVLIVGGETQGLGAGAYKFAHDNSGRIVSIPLGNNIESLNSSVALGIIVFEMQRQFTGRTKRAMRPALDGST